MRSFRPSTKSIAVAGGLAVALVIGGAAGAVADKLITSKDIKNRSIKTWDLDTDSVQARNIAPGSVSWEKSLDEATKAQIEALVSAGEPGPAGPQGEPGPQGPRGSHGSDGADGDGTLVAGGIFGLDGYAPWGEGELSALELLPHEGETMELDEPGNYLVTVRGVVAPYEFEEFPFLLVGEPDDMSGAIFDACIPSSVFAEVPLPICDSTFPVTVESGETVALPVLAPFLGGEECEIDCEPVALARVAVYRMGGEPNTDLDLPDVGDCESACDTDLRLSGDLDLEKLAKQLLRNAS